MGFTVSLSLVPRHPTMSPTPWSERDILSGSGDIQLENANEFAYLVPLSIGGQHFEAIFDTGSSDLWIVSSACNDDDCQKIEKYDPTPKLLLSNAPFDLTYLTGAVSGAIGYETIAVGPYVVFSQALGLANSTRNMGLSTTGTSGVLGLSFPVEASIPVTVGRTLLENIFSSLEPPNRFFSYKLSADLVSSSFSIAQIDPVYANREPEISYSPVYASEGADYDYWKLPLLSLSVNSNSVSLAFSPSKDPRSSSPLAILDTGTTLILGPTHDVDVFWTAAGGAQKGADGSWRVRCNHALTVGLLLGNDTKRTKIILDPSDVSWMPATPPSDGWCSGGIQGNDGVFSGDWLLGDIFLRSAYVVHRAATSSSPPLIGLLGTTNASHALNLFQASRGNDTLSSPFVHSGLLLHNRPPMGPRLIILSTCVFPFLGGVALVVLFRMYREKANCKCEKRLRR
ncbi:hypothetical protein M0805_008968 [Coniferiporia weirii]|nr:hypothetical protein M0805_008968 [Coniferiporia weirii]